MRTSWYCNAFRIIDTLWKGSSCHRWICLTKVQQCGVLVFSSLLFWTSCWANSQLVSDLGPEERRRPDTGLTVDAMIHCLVAVAQEAQHRHPVVSMKAALCLDRDLRITQTYIPGQNLWPFFSLKLFSILLLLTRKTMFCSYKLSPVLFNL